MGIGSQIHFAWLAGYVITLPCIFAHFGIIVMLNFKKSRRDPTNHLVVNLSVGAILEQMTVGLILIEDFITLVQSSVLCGLRAICVRTGPAMISFTLMLLVVQGSYFTRHPGLLAFPQKTSALTTGLLILTFSSVLLIPIYFMRDYNPDVEMKFKCVQVLLLGNAVYDTVYRCTIFIVTSAIPAIILLRELWRLFDTMKAYGMRNSNEETEVALSLVEKFQIDKIRGERLRFVRNSFIFIFLFVSFSVPYAILDMTNSPAVSYPKEVKFYKKTIETIIYLIGYIVIQVYPVYMFYLNRCTSTH